MESKSRNTTSRNVNNSVTKGNPSSSTSTVSNELDQQSIKHKSIMAKYAGSIEFSDSELSMMLQQLKDDK
jgi:hypothetical protein